MAAVVLYPLVTALMVDHIFEGVNGDSEIGNDSEFRSAIACPTIRIEGLTVGGE